MNQLTAQLGFLLIQGDLMAAIPEGHGSIHTGRSAADYGNLLLLFHRGDHPVNLILQTDQRVHGAEGAELIGVVGYVAFVAADTGGDILTSALIELLAVFAVADPASCHADQIRLLVGNDGFAEIGIVETGSGADQQLGTPASLGQRVARVEVKPVGCCGSCTPLRMERMSQ